MVVVSLFEPVNPRRGGGFGHLTCNHIAAKDAFCMRIWVSVRRGYRVHPWHAYSSRFTRDPRQVHDGFIDNRVHDRDIVRRIVLLEMSDGAKQNHELASDVHSSSLVAVYLT